MHQSGRVSYNERLDNKWEVCDVVRLNSVLTSEVLADFDKREQPQH